MNGRIWDPRDKSLFLARDRFGKKPLVYAETPTAFLFASEAKALLRHPEVSRDIDYESIDLYLTYQYIPSPKTVFRQIKKIPPAHTLVWRAGKLSLRKYWNPSFQPKTSLGFEEASVTMMAKLREATKLRMISDVPVGAFLSGGKDSSVIVGLMSELSSHPVKTFSIGFEEEDFSELPFARIVAQRFQTDHHEFIVQPDAVDILPKLAWHYGEPYADSSALPSFYVSQMTRKHVTVALNGDGGDETLAGYPRYQAMKVMSWWTRLPFALRQSIYRTVRLLPEGTPPYSFMWRLQRLLSLGLLNTDSTYADTLCYFRQDHKEGIYSDFLKQQCSDQWAPGYLRDILRRADSRDGVDAFQYADLQSYLPECLMVKMDIASMANSLETRSPFLDHEFVELLGSFPSSWKLKGLFRTKYILDHAIKGWMPDEIIRRKKRGFAIPMGHWFKGKLKTYVEGMLLSDKALSRGLFRREGLEKMLSDNASGLVDHSYRLWALLMLEHWFQIYIDPSKTTSH
jgi:asparagine synthase (glutamine-hydrolysing)